MAIEDKLMNEQIPEEIESLLKKKLIKPFRKCLLPSCPLMHNHNGGYCSPEHSRQHTLLREGQKNTTVTFPVSLQTLEQIAGSLVGKPVLQGNFVIGKVVKTRVHGNEVEGIIKGINGHHTRAILYKREKQQ